VILGEGDAFRLEDFSLSRRSAKVPSAPPPLNPPGEDLNLDRAERQIVEAALRKHGYNISSAATELGLSRAALYRRMEKYGL
jgi:DNA-binding NtrC family response regulator